MIKNQNIPVLFINLERRQDRRDRLEKSISNNEYQLVRILATDARHLARESANDQLLPLGEVACWKSHRTAYEFLQRGNVAYGLILEDDADFSAGKFNPRLLRDLCDYMSAHDVGVLQVGYLHRQYSQLKLGPFLETIREVLQGKYRKIRTRNGGTRWIVFNSFRSGAHAYIVSLEAATFLANMNEPAAFPTDNFLGLLANSANPKLKVARLRESLINQWSRKTLRVSELDSDIAPIESN